MLWCHGGATLVGVTSTSNASPTRETNDTVATKCRRLIYGFSQCSVVLRCELRYDFDEGCTMFMRGH